MGIDICLETHGGLLATGEISKELIQDIGKHNIGINYDPGNVIFYGGHPARGRTSKPSADTVNHMHVKDQIGGPGVWNFPPVGTGEVDFTAIFAALDEAGFNGHLLRRDRVPGRAVARPPRRRRRPEDVLRIRAPVREVGMFPVSRF